MLGHFKVYKSKYAHTCALRRCTSFLGICVRFFVMCGILIVRKLDEFVSLAVYFGAPCWNICLIQASLLIRCEPDLNNQL